MVADVFGLHVRAPNENEIDAGAEALRQVEQGGRLLRKWADLPPSDKKKWIEKSRIVLVAAYAAR